MRSRLERYKAFAPALVQAVERSRPLAQLRWSARIVSELSEVPCDITTAESVPYIRLCPMFASSGEDARPFLETPQCQWDIGGDVYVDS
jgi:hypothetical protein